MEIKTKYNLGQTVQAIVVGRKNVKIKCPVCSKGQVEIPKFGKSACPKCLGSGHYFEVSNEKWYVPEGNYHHFIIEKIGVELNQNKKKRSWIYYMGANGGSMFDENNVFASIKEAKAECKKRNKK